MGSAQRIVLWHIEISHYSEKVRWALAHKSLAHERRTPPPGLHIAVAAWLTRGRAATLPIIELGGERIADSSAIIAALEARFPQPPLYPDDAAHRRRALELSGWFDRELGPYIRRFAFYELNRDPKLVLHVAAQAAPAVAARLGRLLVPYSRAFTGARYGAASPRAAGRARAKVVAALDRLEAELGGSRYLAGERFSVADLTAACLFIPLVFPRQATVQVDELPQPYESFRASLADRPGYRWVQEMFARHRHNERAPSALAHDPAVAEADRAGAMGR